MSGTSSVFAILLIATLALAFVRSEKARTRLLRLAQTVDLRYAAVIAGALLVVLGLAGSHLGGEPVALLDLDEEENIPTATSTLALLTGAALAWLLGTARLEPGPDANVAKALSLLLLFLAMDEAAEIHERPEHWTGVAWQWLYLPVILAGSIVWLLALRSFIRPGVGRACFLAAPLGPLAGALLDKLQFRGPPSSKVKVESYEGLVVLEEMLELAGWMLLAAALVIALRHPVRAGGKTSRWRRRRRVRPANAASPKAKQSSTYSP